VKKRLDILMVERGLFTGRDKAKGAIMAGQVYVDNQKADKPGMEVNDACLLEYRGDALPYVSRGGLKLEKALRLFPIGLEGAVCMDVGASTGGFTDCMLQQGAAKVYAVDVGYGQLAWKLRQDSRVVVLERTNIRHLPADALAEPLDFVSVDVSFISLGLVLPVVHRHLRPVGEAVCLIKPQFEAGREKVGKNGVVRDSAVHRQVMERVVRTAESGGFRLGGLTYSPIKGPKGNIEYLMYLRKGAAEPAAAELFARVVAAAHSEIEDLCL